MEKAPRRKFRPFQVCYKQHRVVSNMTKEELIEQIKQGDVDWVNYESKRFDISRLKIPKPDEEI